MSLSKRIGDVLLDEDRRKKTGRPQTEEEKAKLKIVRKYLKDNKIDGK